MALIGLSEEDIPINRIPEWETPYNTHFRITEDWILDIESISFSKILLGITVKISLDTEREGHYWKVKTIPDIESDLKSKESYPLELSIRYAEDQLKDIVLNKVLAELVETKDKLTEHIKALNTITTLKATT